MYADPHALLRLAGEIRERGAQVRRLAAAIEHEATSVDWEGSAADAMRRMTRLGHASLVRLADDHDRVADLVADHAHRVARRLDAVGGALRWLADAA